MMEQERLLGRAGMPQSGQGVVPEQRGPADPPPYQGVSYAGVPYRPAQQPSPHAALPPEPAFAVLGGSETPQRESAPEPSRGAAPDAVARTGGRSPRASGARLRVDARRNLESVLRAAREVFGEFGYDAPMEEVARRAGVGVGTVYRRFPSKEVLVRRIAAEEVAWLTAQARESLYNGAGPWDALAGYLARAVGSGAGRLLPPEAFRYARELGRIPGQRGTESWESAARADHPRPGSSTPVVPGGTTGSIDADPRLLLQLLAALVARAGAAGELRPGVTVSDVVLVLTASVPVHAWQAGSLDGSDAGTPPGWAPDAAAVDSGLQGERLTDGQPGNGPGERLLTILLDGLRAR
ncbi:TetR family transcriptional regulator [Kitasatospora sp. NBC_00315]|uniref:TetR family transcriptional regulator n=1 Tax=Kitasatospora sp. NBC_00315 TaxID=2975963 RepID=UPI00324F316E